LANRLRRTRQPSQAPLDWDRTRLDGLTGARAWCGYGVLAHNITKITALAAADA
jgi:IS5 family transposase